MVYIVRHKNKYDLDVFMAEGASFADRANGEARVQENSDGTYLVRADGLEVKVIGVDSEYRFGTSCALFLNGHGLRVDNARALGGSWLIPELEESCPDEASDDEVMLEESCPDEASDDEVMSEQELFESLVDKVLSTMPMLDPTWTPAEAALWTTTLERLLRMALEIAVEGRDESN